MVKMLEQAVAELANLPDAVQEQIERKLLSHIERLRELRSEIDKGIGSLNAGKGNEVDIEQFLAKKRGHV